MIFFLNFTPIPNYWNLMLQVIPQPPQKSQRTKSLIPQFEYMSVKSVTCGYLAIKNPWSNLVGVLRCRIFFFLASAPRLEMRAKDSTILGFKVGLNQTLGHQELKQ